MFLGLVGWLLRVLSESDSEYERLLLIQTPFSYKLNPVTIGTSTKQNCMVGEVIGVTERLHALDLMERLDDLLVDVVDETLKEVFRDEGTRAIYDYLENKSHLRREEIAERPEIFSAGLEMLMVSAAQVIEKMIVKRLYSKLGLRFREREGYEFSDYVKELRSAVAKG